MAHPVKIALVGMGWWGQKMLSVLQSAPADIQVVRAVEPNVESVRQLCADKGIALSADYGDALKDPAVEAVVLATPPGVQRVNVRSAAQMHAAVFAALKPGGRYILIDHQAAPGTGISAVQTLHRIEGDYLRREVEAAGFVFEGESRAVANPDDDHSLNVFDAAIRGKTDQFVYRFRKPG